MSNKNTPFSQQLAYLSRGLFDSEATEKLAEVVQSVRETGKTGEFALIIKVTKLNARDENALKLAPTIKVKIPKQAPYETIMFSTADGDLLRDDPHQSSLELEVVTKPRRADLLVTPQQPKQMQ